MTCDIPHQIQICRPDGGVSQEANRQLFSFNTQRICTNSDYEHPTDDFGFHCLLRPFVDISLFLLSLFSTNRAVFLVALQATTSNRIMQQVGSYLSRRYILRFVLEHFLHCQEDRQHAISPLTAQTCVFCFVFAFVVSLQPCCFLILFFPFFFPFPPIGLLFSPLVFGLVSRDGNLEGVA